ncbi:MAG: single-stranded-DNA-specific exonuclease RecJ [Chloroflexota bacterium]|nr:single-stranded-DNA-specific exonuclease RecJ [Chloroflexota bacterium]MDE2909142.1 single-stranded-DNA-specific exonuclease RecJ [Chloroflexota bacterium]
MMQKEWVLAPRAPAERLERYRGFSPILAQLLINRGFEDPNAAREFVSGQALSEDPFHLQDMDAAVARLNGAIAEQEPIAVYGDFDADGVCATALLTQTVRALGGDVLPYIPDRADEGYGLNTPALENLARRGIKLVVTVDCGIRSIAEVEAGLRAGLDIIVTDHHSIGPELPPALAVINPQRDDCAGEARLAGVGVAFMLAKALLLHRWATERHNYPAGLRQSDLLDLVALGAVADVSPLNAGLNRRLVKHGLDTINEMRRPGVAALIKVAGLKPGGVKARDIGFGLGPRINAAGRLGSAMVAYDLLAAQSIEEAMPRAIQLQSLNAQRQQLTRQALAAISEQVGDDPDRSLIFAGDENLQSGIVGLVAGRLAETFYRPAVVMEYGEVESRASCRSIPEFNITRALDECADLLLRHGGHAVAAGFTIQNSNIDVLRQELAKKADADLRGRKLAPKLAIDSQIQLAELDASLLAELDLLEPTGHENEKGVFLTSDLRVLQCRRVGEDGRHLKLKVAEDGGPPVDAIGFGLGEWAQEMPRRIDAAYHAEINEWGERRSLQLRLLDIRPAMRERGAVSG